MTFHTRNQYGDLRNKSVNSHPVIKGEAPLTVGHDKNKERVRENWLWLQGKQKIFLDRRYLMM